MPLPWRSLGLGLTLLALVVCAPPRVTAVPEALQDLAPLDPYLFELTARWKSGGAAGEVPVGELLRQVLVDDPQAAVRPGISCGPRSGSTAGLGRLFRRAMRLIKSTN